TKGLPLVDTITRVLKFGRSFAVFDPSGDIIPGGKNSLGFYHESTRFLSHFELRLYNRRPLLLSSSVVKDNTLLAVDLTNPTLQLPSGNKLGQGSLHFFRTSFLSEEALFERVQIHNYDVIPSELELSLICDCDFADIFEIRGIERSRRGVIHSV